MLKVCYKARRQWPHSISVRKTSGEGRAEVAQLFLFSCFPFFPSLEASSTCIQNTRTAHYDTSAPFQRCLYKKTTSKIPLVHKSMIAFTELYRIGQSYEVYSFDPIKHSLFHVLDSACLQITAKLRHRYKHPIKQLYSQLCFSNLLYWKMFVLFS